MQPDGVASGNDNSTYDEGKRYEKDADNATNKQRGQQCLRRQLKKAGRNEHAWHA